MGTRSGDIDPGAMIHLLRMGMSVDDLDTLLNRSSGLKGLCGDNDLREVHRRAAAGDEVARSALDVYVHRIRAYLGAYLVELGGADAVVFTAGVGENDPQVRAAVCAGLQSLGIEIDETVNSGVRGPLGPVDVATPDSRVRVLVVPTDEELEIATSTLATIN
jgi:acetate kinase